MGRVFWQIWKIELQIIKKMHVFHLLTEKYIARLLKQFTSLTSYQMHFLQCRRNGSAAAFGL